jgi:CRISPR/Cas system CSM-associated protein Csm2 small subunit
MKYRGKEYEEAIKALKQLSAEMKIRGRKSEIRNQYVKAMKKVCEQFGLSKKTIYRDMRKRVPGLRKTRNDAGKVRSPLKPLNRQKAEEMISAGHTREFVKQQLKLSERKMKRMREKAKSRGRSKTRLVERSEIKGQKSMYGIEARKFFEKLFDYNLIAPSKGIALKHNGVSFLIGKEDLDDIILILSNAYNRFCFAEEKKLKLDRGKLRTALMYHIVEDQMRLAKEGADYKLVEALTRMLDRLNEDAKLPDDFETMVKVCQQLKHDIGREEVIEIIKKVSIDS